MSGWETLLMIAIGALLVWWCIRMVKGNRGAFTWINFEKTSFTLAILALIMIAVVVIAVYFLRHA